MAMETQGCHRLNGKIEGRKVETSTGGDTAKQDGYLRPGNKKVFNFNQMDERMVT